MRPIKLLKEFQMQTDFDVYAIQISEENIPQIIDVTRPLGWCLTHLPDSLEYNTEEFGMDTWLFMKLYKDTTEIATFSDEAHEPSIEYPYHLTKEVDPKFGIFYKVEKI